VPAIVCVTGPMGTGSHKGERLGACTDCRRMWGKFRAGEIDEAEIEDISSKLVPTAGTCGVMGTASTMALMTEAMGMMLPGGAAIPAFAADRLRHAEETGTRAVALAKDKVTPDRIITQAALNNAMKTLLAVGGSTNGIVHMAAVAGRLGLSVDLDAFDTMGRDVPMLVDLKPNGSYYMEDLWKAGGLTTILREIEDLLDLDCLTVSGKTLGENLAAMPAGWPQDVVRPRGNPLFSKGSMAVLRGNLAPNGAVLKQSAADQGLLVHEGRAVVFENLEDLAERIDSADLDVTADDVLVLRNIGPKGAPGMPEAGYIPIPKKLASQGVKDMVRISDGRMSGTAFGTIILHVSPEAADGGPLALVQTGDRIRLDTPNRSLTLLVDDTEMTARRAAWTPPPAHKGSGRGYLKLYLDTVTQAEDGADFGFLKAVDGA
jgi:dihydroxy-acid dehydratase